MSIGSPPFFRWRNVPRMTAPDARRRNVAERLALLRHAHVVGRHGEKRVASVAVEPHRRLVHAEEALRLDIDHPHRQRAVLEQHPVAALLGVHPVDQPLQRRRQEPKRAHSPDGSVARRLQPARPWRSAKPVNGNSYDCARAAGLRYVSDAAPGIVRRRRGKAFHYRHADGGPVRDRRTLGRIRALAIPPAWTRRLDLPRRRRPPPGHRPRCAPPQAVPLSPALARGARRDEVRPADRRSPRALPRIRAPRRARPRASRPAAREGAGDRGAPARDDARTHRQRGIRARERLVRPHHAARAAGAGARLERSGSAFAARAASSTRSSSTIAGSRASCAACRTCPAKSCSSYVDDDGETRAHRVRRRQRLPARRSRARISPARISAPGPARCSPPARCTRSGLAPPRPSGKRNIAQAIAAVAGALGNTTAVCRKCYIHPEILESYLEGELGDFMQREGGSKAAEKAVAALLKARARRAAATARRSGADGRSLVPALARSLGSAARRLQRTEHSVARGMSHHETSNHRHRACWQRAAPRAPKPSRARASARTAAASAATCSRARFLRRRPRPGRAPTRPAPRAPASALPKPASARAARRRPRSPTARAAAATR